MTFQPEAMADMMKVDGPGLGEPKLDRVLVAGADLLDRREQARP